MIRSLLDLEYAASAIFTNPLISVLPRLFIGPVAWLVYRSISRIKQGPASERGSNLKKVIAIVASGIAGSMTNTVLVLSVIGLFGMIPWSGLPGIVWTNGVPEAGVAAIITLVVVVAWDRIERGLGVS